MIETPAPIQSPSWPWGSTRVTAIYRAVEGQPQIVLVCEACDEIHTITVQEAMRVALDRWMDRHEKTRHAVSSPANTDDTQLSKPD